MNAVSWILTLNVVCGQCRTQNVVDVMPPDFRRLVRLGAGDDTIGLIVTCEICDDRMEVDLGVKA